MSYRSYSNAVTICDKISWWYNWYPSWTVCWKRCSWTSNWHPMESSQRLAVMVRWYLFLSNQHMLKLFICNRICWIYPFVSSWKRFEREDKRYALYALLSFAHSLPLSICSGQEQDFAFLGRKESKPFGGANELQQEHRYDMIVLLLKKLMHMVM